MAAARRRSAANKATKEAFDQLAQTAAGSAPAPEEVEHLKQATDTTAPEAVQIQMADLDAAMKRLTDSFSKRITVDKEIAKDFVSTLIEDELSSIDGFTQKISEELISRFQELSEAHRAGDKTVGIYNTVKESIKAAIDRFIPGADEDERIEVWCTLAPYINAEAAEHPEKYGNSLADQATANELVKTAAARARADRKTIPTLKIEDSYIEDAENNNSILLAASQQKAIKIRPRLYVSPISAIMNILKQPEAINQTFPYDALPAKGKRKEPIQNFVTIDYSASGINLEMTEAERQVTDAVMSIWYEADRSGLQPIFTIDDVYCAMPGAGNKPGSETEEFIRRTLDKYDNFKITINATNEFRQRNIIGEDAEQWFKGTFFSLFESTTKAPHSNYTIKQYMLTSKPILLDYAEITKQYISISAKHLQIRKVIKTDKGLIPCETIKLTLERQAITGYMLRRIAIMRHDLENAKELYRRNENKRKKDSTIEFKPVEAFTKQSHNILFDTLFEETKTLSDNRVQQQRNREFCFQALEYWIATELITGYETVMSGRKIRGIKVNLK